MDNEADALKEFLGRDEWIPFYGVDGELFKLGEVVLEAEEDPDDGYRSYLRSIRARPDAGGIFPAQPVAMVKVREAESTPGPSYRSFDGYEIYDASGHVWLLVGTDDHDDYYPTFTFRYEPSGEQVSG